MNDSCHPPPAVHRLFALAVWLAGGTGVAYAVLRYLWPKDDPFAVVNHPWQPHFQHLHVLVVPLAVFTLGAMWVAHILPARGQQVSGRGSGFLAWWLAGVVVLSGVLVQVLVDPGARVVTGWVHTGASLAWLVMLLVHRRRRGRTPP